MTKPLKIYIGFDPRQQAAFDVARRSLLHHASVPVEIVALTDWDLRARGLYWRTYRVEANGQCIDDRDGRPFSTQFSFTRFAVPLLEDFGETPVLYTDADVMWRADVAELFALADPAMAVQVVKHDMGVTGGTKMDGRVQTPNTHGRKNWSSVMLIKPSRCALMDRYRLNNMTGEWLHGLLWVPEEEIGALPAAWNHLVDIDDPTKPAKLVHFTLGLPDVRQVPAQYADEWWLWTRHERVMLPPDADKVITVLAVDTAA